MILVHLRFQVQQTQHWSCCNKDNVKWCRIKDSKCCKKCWISNSQETWRNQVWKLLNCLLFVLCSEKVLVFIIFFFFWFVPWRGSSMFQSLETRVVSASSSIKVRNSFFFAGENNINCYASSCTSGLSKQAGCWGKSPSTWLLSAGYSAWHFFVDGCLSSLLAAWNVSQEKWNFPSGEERGEVPEFAGYRGAVSKHH